MSPAVQVERLCCRLGGRLVLDEVSFAVARGRVCVLAGPNGAGKTSLLRVLAGLLPRERGDVRIEDHDPGLTPPAALARIVALLPQSPSVPPGLTVRELVAWGRTPFLRGIAGPAEDDLRQVDGALEATGTRHLADRFVETLSGGERHRVLLARALAQTPRVLLLDEPTVHLDAGHQTEVMRLLRRLAADGVTVLAVLHDLPLAAAFGDAAVVLGGGRVVAAGPPADVLRADVLQAAYGGLVAGAYLRGDPGPLVPRGPDRPPSRSRGLASLRGIRGRTPEPMQGRGPSPAPREEGEAIRRQPVIAIDGPSASGKSTLARALARRLGFRHVDSGAMYRAVAWAALQQGVPLDDAEAVGRLAEALAIEFVPEPAGDRLRVGGQDVTEAIRAPEVTAAASRVSAIPGVRAALVAHQRRLAAGGGVVMDGRDIGTVVLPDAEVKVFLDASLDVRARRRHAELLARGIQADLDTVRREEAERDERDASREHSPLRAAPDAVVIDSTSRTVDELVETVLGLVRIRTAP